MGDVMITRRQVMRAGLVAAGAAMAGSPARADFPDRMIRWIVPFPAGGGLDAVTRIVAGKLADNIGQNVIVENKSGGSGFIGIVALTQSKPDGYTLMMQALGMSMNPSIYKRLPYDPVNDIQPVAQIGAVPVIVAIGPKVEVATLAEFVALAKSQPRRYKGAAFAVGSSTLMFEMFKLQAGVDVSIVPYRGVVDAVAATVGGETDLVIMDGTSVVPHIKAGRLRGLAVAAKARMAELPDVPTTTEVGLPDYRIEFWYAAFTRGGTPSPIVARLNSEINKAVAAPEVTGKLKAMGLTPLNRTADEFTNQHHREMKEWAEVVKQSGFKLLEISQ